MSEIFVAQNWADYKVLDAGDGKKLESWGGHILSRPDPQAIWPKERPRDWAAAEAEYERSHSGGGAWHFHKKLPERWTICRGDLRFYVRPTGFKHTGLFPEQAANWDYMASRLAGQKGRSVLNLFAYTGGATLACAAAGAAVTHVDAAKGMVAWAKENAQLSGLGQHPIRYIVDDCMKFVLREQRRGRRYDGIVMDPPSYGRGADGQVWKVETHLYGLIEEAAKLLTDDPLFFLVNSYTTGLSATVTSNMLKRCLPWGRVESGDLSLPIENSALLLPCGTTARWRP